MLVQLQLGNNYFHPKTVSDAKINYWSRVKGHPQGMFLTILNIYSQYTFPAIFLIFCFDY